MKRRGKLVSIGALAAIAVAATLALTITGGNALTTTNGGTAPGGVAAATHRKGYHCNGRICTWGTKSDTGRSVRGWARVGDLWTSYQYKVRVYVYKCYYADDHQLDACYRQTVSAFKYSSYGASAVSQYSDWVPSGGDYMKTYAHFYKRKRGSTDWAFGAQVTSYHFT